MHQVNSTLMKGENVPLGFGIITHNMLGLVHFEALKHKSLEPQTLKEPPHMERPTRIYWRQIRKEPCERPAVRQHATDSPSTCA